VHFLAGISREPKKKEYIQKLCITITFFRSVGDLAIKKCSQCNLVTTMSPKKLSKDLSIFGYDSCCLVSTELCSLYYINFNGLCAVANLLLYDFTERLIISFGLEKYSFSRVFSKFSMNSDNRNTRYKFEVGPSPGRVFYACKRYDYDPVPGSYIPGAPGRLFT